MGDLTDLGLQKYSEIWYVYCTLFGFHPDTGDITQAWHEFLRDFFRTPGVFNA